MCKVCAETLRVLLERNKVSEAEVQSAHDEAEFRLHLNSEPEEISELETKEEAIASLKEAIESSAKAAGITASVHFEEIPLGVNPMEYIAKRRAELRAVKDSGHRPETDPNKMC